MIQNHSKQVITNIDKLFTQVNTDSDTPREVLRKPKDLEESLIANQDVIYIEYTTLEEQIKKFKLLLVDKKDPEIEENIRVQEDTSRPRKIRIDEIQEEENETWQETK